MSILSMYPFVLSHPSTLIWQAKLKGLEKSLAEAKKAFNQATQQLKALEQRAKVLELEMAELQGENSNMDEQVGQGYLKGVQGAIKATTTYVSILEEGDVLY